MGDKCPPQVRDQLSSFITLAVVVDSENSLRLGLYALDARALRRPSRLRAADIVHHIPLITREPERAGLARYEPGFGSKPCHHLDVPGQPFFGACATAP